MNRFAIDYDGTIADTNLAKSQWIKRNINLDIPPWRCDRTLCEQAIGADKYNEMARYVYGRELSQTASEVQGVRQALMQLKKLGSLFVLTARDSEVMQWAEMWLAEHGIRNHINQLLSSSGQSKLKLCSKFGVDVLIDDDQRHLTEPEPINICRILLKSGISGTLDLPEYVTLCRDWDEVVTVIKQRIFNNTAGL